MVIATSVDKTTGIVARKYVWRAGLDGVRPADSASKAGGAPRQATLGRDPDLAACCVGLGPYSLQVLSVRLHNLERPLGSRAQVPT